MITNNGKALMYVSDWYEDNSNDPTYILQRTNGTEAQIKRNTTAYDKKLGYSSLANNIKIVVGTGTTSPVPADCSLGNEITSSSLKIIASNSRNHDYCDTDYNVGIIMEASATLMNISTTDTITINEVGLVTQDDTGASYLLMREVLNTPITLAPNEITALTLGVNKGTSSDGLTGNGVALCYVNNFGNGKNNKGETEYPYIILDVKDTGDADTNARRSIVEPIGHGAYTYCETSYKNIIDSLTIVPMVVSGTSFVDYDDVLYSGTVFIDVSESCKNKDVDISKYSEPVILQATKTIRNQKSNSPSYEVARIELRAKNYKGANSNNIWETTDKEIVMASIDLDSSVYLGPGESASFTIVVG